MCVCVCVFVRVFVCEFVCVWVRAPHTCAHSMCQCVVTKCIVLTFTVGSSEVFFANTAITMSFLLTVPAVLAWSRYTRVFYYTNQIGIKYSAY